MVKLFVGGITAEGSTTSEELRGIFEEYGEVSECSIVKNFAFVHMPDESCAEVAINNINGIDLNGCNLHVTYSSGGGERVRGSGEVRGRGGDLRGRGGRGRGAGPPNRGVDFDRGYNPRGRGTERGRFNSYHGGFGETDGRWDEGEYGMGPPRGRGGFPGQRGGPRGYRGGHDGWGRGDEYAGDDWTQPEPYDWGYQGHPADGYPPYGQRPPRRNMESNGNVGYPLPEKRPRPAVQPLEVFTYVDQNGLSRDPTNRPPPEYYYYRFRPHETFPDKANDIATAST